MLNQDNIQTAAVFSEKALRFLKKYLVAPNPVNFAVAYCYYTARIPELNQAIDQQLADYNYLDGVFLEYLFVNYLSNSENIDKSFVEPFNQSLAHAKQQIDLQVDSGLKIASNLSRVNQALSNTEHHKSIKNVVGYLMDTIKSSKQQYQYLSDELAKTSQEVNVLRVKLKETRQAAIMDNLTGLLNRRGCEDSLQELVLDELHSSLMIDIDYFKQINDTFGHMIGDRVIQRVAGVIKQHVSSNDLAVRYGGEEFLVVLVNKAISDASLIAEKIRRTVNELRLVQRHSKQLLPPISVSIGIAQTEQETSWEDLFQRADDALYKAKESGRNCCILA
jgi:diguanylate cyclase